MAASEVLPAITASHKFVFFLLLGHAGLNQSRVLYTSVQGSQRLIIRQYFGYRDQTRYLDSTKKTLAQSSTSDGDFNIDHVTHALSKPTPDGCDMIYIKIGIASRTCTLQTEQNPSRSKMSRTGFNSQVEHNPIKRRTRRR
ncbi:hypothetical protein P167DRAFT_209673 [Morchella conica CCBAS932]|uniref:Uncharacterized protein n=1 Tax=Morchella conica CCBAS932 TaxID=1392247 RepID=A0A3N4KM12_9PEZI|nr:hypothetical protein P167DRAFT_209673 [Morchella conica CCBAS932]